MDFSVAQRALENMAEASTLFLVISGGEPTIHPNFSDFILLASRLGFSLSLSTNGYILNEKILEVLVNSTTTEIGVSLYAMDEKINDSITMKKGSFTKIMENLETLSKTNISVAIKTPVLHKNYREIGKIANFCKKMGFRFKPDPMITQKNSGEPSPLKHSAADEEIIDAMMNFPEKRIAVEGVETKLCNAGKNYYAIDVFGNILPCIQLPLVLGNVMDNSIKQLWFTSKILRELREITLDKLTKCINCEYNLYCDRCPGLVFIEHGNLTDCSVINYRIARLAMEAASRLK